MYSATTPKRKKTPIFGLKSIGKTTIEHRQSSRVVDRMSEEPQIPQFSSFVRRDAISRWKTWLHKRVFVNEDDYRTVLPRYKAIEYFCNKGLIPFVHHHGYVFKDISSVGNDLVDILYNGRDSEWKFQPFRRRLFRAEQDADYEYYLYNGIPQDDWDIFWRTWGKMTDFYGDNHKNMFWIPYFVYARLDLTSSSTTMIVDKEFEDFEDENGGHPYESSDPLYTKDKNSLY